MEKIISTLGLKNKWTSKNIYLFKPLDIFLNYIDSKDIYFQIILFVV